MRVIARSHNEHTLSLLVHKIKINGLKIYKESKKGNYVSFDIPRTKSDLFYDLMEQNGQLERDVQHDLD